MVASVRPVNAPRAVGLGTGQRSPASVGTNATPSQPGGTAPASRSRSACTEQPSAIARASASRATVSRNHRMLPPALSITLIRCQRPGSAWQKAWSAPSGEARNESQAAKSTPLVPRFAESVPGAAMPAPTAAAAWSPAPATSGIPAGRPSCAAAAGDSRSTTSGDSWHAGTCAGSIPRSRSMSALHRRLATSKYSVPLASAASVARAPPSRRRR